MFEGKEVKVILSQAGGGKTTYLLQLVADELRTRRPEEIAFVTFTKKGAEEGLTRMCNNYSLTPDELPYFKTLHSLTFHALSLKSNQMFNRINERAFNKEYGYNVNRCEMQSRKVQATKDSEYLDYYDLDRSGALTSKMIARADIETGYYHQIVRKYEEYKSRQCLVDFFDCLIKYEQSGDSLPCKVVFVDEAQDITVLQWKVIERAFAGAEKVYISGDENQSIFTYSGARPDMLIGLSKQYPTSYLKESYRIPKSVYNLSKGIVDFIQEKTDKPFEFHEGNEEGSITELMGVERLRSFISADVHDKPTCDWYLLARNKCMFEKYTEILEDNLIPYWTSDGFFMGGQIMSRLKDYTNFSKLGYRNEAKKEAFMSKYGITDFSTPFTDTALFTEGRKWVYASYIEKYGLDKLADMCKWNPQILVSTIHYVKGGEAENVSILLSSTGRTQANVMENIDEELRVLYVGVTRTKKNLYLIDSSSDKAYDRIISTIKDQYGLNW